MPTDRQRLASFLEALDGHDFVGLPPKRGRMDQSAGHEDAAEAVARRGLSRPSYVFWHQQADERAFDADGALVADLMLNWGGDHARVAAALASCPAPFVVVDNGSRGAFAIRRPVVRTDAVGDEADVKRRLGQIHTELRDDPEAARRWLLAVVASPGRGARLAALRALGETAPREALEAFAAELQENVAAAGKRDELSLVHDLAAVLGLLRGSPAYEATRARLCKERQQIYRRLMVQIVAEEPWSEPNEALLRAHVDDPRLRYAAVGGLVRSLAARDGVPEEGVALHLAEDETLSNTARDEMLDVACRRRAYRAKGCVALAEDTGVGPGLRSRALTRACRYLRFAKDAALLAQVETLVASGLPVDAEALKDARNPV